MPPVAQTKLYCDDCGEYLMAVHQRDNQGRERLVIRRRSNRHDHTLVFQLDNFDSIGKNDGQTELTE